MRKRHHLACTLLVVLFLAPAGANAHNVETSSGAYVASVVLSEVSGGGQTSAWVVLKSNASASVERASTIEDWNQRGKFVYERLTRQTENSQADLRKLLDERGVEYQAFWIVNAILVKADAGVIDELARQPEVEQILPDQDYHIPEPIPAADLATRQLANQDIPWGLDSINAPDVWSTLGVRGEGIVVASIDTGVQFDHPALAAHYRGNLGGSFNHNYNWFDPTGVCADSPPVPCDDDLHGTHVTGTMVGDDGGANQIGVAPGAKWIAAKGCRSRNCSVSALLAAGQWMLAPKDVNGGNPRPDLRPHIINNSWGIPEGGTFYQEIVDAWVASGIFPMFANGNYGPSCRSSASPGQFVATYSAGAFDSNNEIAPFSSRGVSDFGGEIKPNIAAPGVDIRSSVPGNGYSRSSGTSMASPHVAGTIALMWSANPSLIGNIDVTRSLLDQTAIDTENLQCGGTAADNNVFGEGRLDAFAAVGAALNFSEPPEVNAGGPYNGAEGSPIALGGTVSDPENDSLTTTWSYAATSADDGTTCEFGDDSQVDTTFTCTDDGTFTVSLTTDDGSNPTVSDGASVTISNLAPMITDVTTSLTVSEVTITVAATDPGANDVLSYAFDCDADDTYEGDAGVTPSTACPRDVQHEGSFIVGVQVSDDDGGIATDLVTVTIATELCASNITGVLRYSDTCHDHETAVIIAGEATASVCASVHNGLLRSPANGVCAGHETLYLLPNDGPLHVCISQYTQTLRVVGDAGQCASHEFGRVIAATDLEGPTPRPRSR